MDRARWLYLCGIKVPGSRANPPKRRVRERVLLGDFSSFRKLMRLYGQGRVPSERVQVIERAMEKAYGGR